MHKAKFGFHISQDSQGPKRTHSKRLEVVSTTMFNDLCFSGLGTMIYATTQCSLSYFLRTKWLPMPIYL